MSSIELTAPRVIAIESRGKQYLLTLQRIGKKQWLRHFEGIVNSSENQGGKRVDRFDSSGARVALVEEVLVDAKGYKAREPDQPITSIQGWQSQLPLSHRLAAGEALVNVERADPPEDDELVLGFENVFLNAVWGADEAGVMRKYHGLCHRFKTPTAEQQKRFSRESSRSRVVGGSRKGVTQWMGAQATLIDLYDELVLSVDGYTVDGEPLGEDRTGIVVEMDAYHKVAAADALFAPAQPNVSEEG
jgi:hypothetical protein